MSARCYHEVFCTNSVLLVHSVVCQWSVGMLASAETAVYSDGMPCIVHVSMQTLNWLVYAAAGLWVIKSRSPNPRLSPVGDSCHDPKATDFTSLLSHEALPLQLN